MLDNSNIEEKETKSFPQGQFITYGIQELKVNSITLKTASTGSQQFVFNVEGKENDSPDFVGFEGAKGPIGRVEASAYLRLNGDTDQQKQMVNDFQSNMKKVSRALGVEKDFIAVKAETFEDYAVALEALFKGKFARFVVSTKQYYNASNQLRNSLKLPRYDFIEESSVSEAESKLKFDIGNKFHLEQAVVPSSVGTAGSATAINGGNDLPF